MGGKTGRLTQIPTGEGGGPSKGRKKKKRELS